MGHRPLVIRVSLVGPSRTAEDAIPDKLYLVSLFNPRFHLPSRSGMRLSQDAKRLVTARLAEMTFQCFRRDVASDIACQVPAHSSKRKISGLGLFFLTVESRNRSSREACGPLRVNEPGNVAWGDG